MTGQIVRVMFALEMTSETKLFIEPGDVIGVEIQCPNPKCGARLLYKANTMNENPPHKCYNCNRDWFKPSESDYTISYDLSELIEFLKAVKNISGFTAKGLRVRLEISPSSPQ